MKEKLKPVGKAKLQCFGNNFGLNRGNVESRKLTSRLNLPESKNVTGMASDSDTDSKEIKDADENLYKSLLNEEPFSGPSSSQEKGTMTDPSLQKKHKSKVAVNKLVSTGSQNLHSVLQTISKNKADAKVPLVILSKSPQESGTLVNKGLSNENELNREDSLNITKLSSHSLRSELSVIGNKASKIPGKHFSPSSSFTTCTSLSSQESSTDNAATLDYHSDESESTPSALNSSSNVTMSPDFQGFMSPKTKQKTQTSSLHRSLSVHEKRVKKKLFQEMGKGIGSSDNEAAVLDHPYSHGNQEKGRSSSHPVSTESSLPENEYPRYVSRSVFGSPTSSKSPPDIMLHNDKINILRQMSQVFNDEKSRAAVKSESLKSVGSNLSSETNASQKKIMKGSLEPVLRLSDIFSSKTTTTTTTTTNTTTSTATVTTSTITPLTSKNDNSVTTSVTTASVAIISEKEKTVDEVPSSEKKDVEENASPLLPKKYSTRKNVKENKTCTKENKENEASDSEESDVGIAKRVHLVSSHSLDKNESIKVKSYSGSKGEDIDIIDGFTFFSFSNEKEMVHYSPSKSIRRLKKRRRARVVKKKKTKTKVSVHKEKVSEDLDTEGSEVIPTKNKEQQFEGFTPKPEKKNVEERNRINELEKAKQIEASSVFASNDLDQYLTEHAQLKISFSIPKCKATEDGVTKFDDEGKPIPSLGSSGVPVPVSESTNPVLDTGTLPSPMVTTKNVAPAPPQPVPVPVSVPVDPPPPVPVTHRVSQVPLRGLPYPKLKQVGLGGGLLVKRRGHFLPLSSVVKKPHANLSEARERALEMIYLYHGGRLLTLAGSLTKVTPNNCRAIRARVALPRGHGRLMRHAKRVASRKVQAVEINEDLAAFALSALKTPTKEEKAPSLDPPLKEPPKEPPTTKYLKPSKENILDILTAKFALDKETPKWDTPLPGDAKPAEGNSFSTTPDAGANPTTQKVSEEVVSHSKIMWTQDDILKKKNSPPSTEPSKALRKNINRFPSLSREMKRLNMNFDSEEEKSEVEEEDTGPCSNAFCNLGCVCDSLKCRRRNPEHCGRAECMFGCSCTVESWRGSKRRDVPISVLSLFNADYERQENLALKEKDFKKTIVQSGSEVFLINGEKRKRDIKIPQRFKDTDIWKRPLSEVTENTTNNKENVPILPSSYKLHIKDFRLNVPWYDIKGASVWCMVHSCYDCYCISDRDFYDSEEIEVPNDEEFAAPLGVMQGMPLVKRPQSVDRDNTLPLRLTECKIVRFNLQLKPPGVRTSDRGRLTLKQWIHNSNLFSARSCGYVLKDAMVKNLVNNREACHLPLPKDPFIMGVTLKKAAEREHVKEAPSEGGATGRKKATFYDGLGPGFQLPAAMPHSDELIVRLSERNQNLSKIYLKTYDLPDADKASLKTLGDVAPSLVTIPQPVSAKELYANSQFIASEEASSAVHQTLRGEVQLQDEKNPSLGPPECMEVSSNASSRSLQREEDPTNRPRAPNDGDSPMGSEKTLSLYEMIMEEEKRGELELDLTPKDQGTAILVTESRFRKLINMNIIGITALNKAGRCIISTVKSSEDLIKMQRIQHLISNNAIDVGPNMREIFAPSWQVEQRVRYVMIRCGSSGKWEIVGVVQRKQKEGDPSIMPKPKRQKSSRVQPQLGKNGNSSSNVTKPLSNKSKGTTPSSTASDVPETSTSGEANAENSVEEVDTPGEMTPDSSPVKEVATSDTESVDSSSVCVSEGFVVERGEEDGSLPCIASVHSANDPEINKLISSPPRPSLKTLVGVGSAVNAPYQQVLVNSGSQALASYVLNQPSAKVFGYEDKSIGREPTLTTTNSTDVEVVQSSVSLATLNNQFRGSFRFDSPQTVKDRNAKVVFCPRGSPTTSATNLQFNQFSLNIPVQRSPVLTQAPVLAQAQPGGSPTGEPIRMLLVPSTTSPGKSILVPASGEVPLSYALVVRKANEPTSVLSDGSIRSYIPPSNLVMSPKRYVPISMATTTKSTSLSQISAGVSSLPSMSYRLANPVPHPSSTVIPNVASSVSMSGAGKWTMQYSEVLRRSHQDATHSASHQQQSLVSHVGLGTGSTTTAVSNSQSIIGQVKFTGSDASKGLISSPRAKSSTVSSALQQKPEQTSPIQSSPDVKCIVVKNREYCSAVDLSIRFRSIKLHWLCGVIKKTILLTIFKMSRRIESPVSLSAKNESMKNSFWGMYKFCIDQMGKPFPVLILGTKQESVMSMRTVKPKELFRSNTIKYLIREPTGEPSSYTYDVRGLSLIKIATKKRETGLKVPGIGRKIPVEMMRDDVVEGIEYPPLTSFASKSTSVKVAEEIIISDDSDTESSAVKSDKILPTTLNKTDGTTSSTVKTDDNSSSSEISEISSSTLKNSDQIRSATSTKSDIEIDRIIPSSLRSPTRPSRPVLVSPLMSPTTGEGQSTVVTSLTTLESNDPVGRLKGAVHCQDSNIKENETTSESVSQESFSERSKDSKGHSSQGESSSGPEEERLCVERLSSPVRWRPVLKIPNPFNKKETSTADSAGDSSAEPEPSRKKSPLKYLYSVKYPIILPAASQSQSNVEDVNVPANTPPLKCLPVKTSSVKPLEPLKSPPKAVTFRERQSKLLLPSLSRPSAVNPKPSTEDAPRSGWSSLLHDSQGSDGTKTGGVPHTSRLDLSTYSQEVSNPTETTVPEEHRIRSMGQTDNSEMGDGDDIGTHLTSSTGSSPTSHKQPPREGALSSTIPASEASGSDTSLTIDDEVDVVSDIGTNFVDLLQKQMLTDVRQQSSQSTREKPCPLSKKPAHKRAEHAPQTTHSKQSWVKGKGEQFSKSKINRRSPPSIGQEFQQVFNGAPQFWLMDNTEKHNTLERIRRKGLAKMLENLWEKTNAKKGPMARLPAKHIVLKEAEKLIMYLRARDVELAKDEIRLREKKTFLLNTLSEHLKDTDDHLQRHFELWISTNISNPTAKIKFEDSWKPQKVTFDDEHIVTNSCGNLTVSGDDITTYYATHTAGFTPSKGNPKFRSSSKSQQMSRRKLRELFPLVPPGMSSKHHHQQGSKKKLSNLIANPLPGPKSAPTKGYHIAQTFAEHRIVSSEDEGETKETEPEDTISSDDNSRWREFILSPPPPLSAVETIIPTLRTSPLIPPENPEVAKPPPPDSGTEGEKGEGPSVVSSGWLQQQLLSLPLSRSTSSNDVSCSSSQLSNHSDDSLGELKLTSPLDSPEGGDE